MAAIDTKIRLQAAALIAEGELSIDAIAKQLGISENTIDKWKKKPWFQAKVNSILAETERRILQRGVASRLRRVEAMNDRWRRMGQLIIERAQDPKMAEVPGGKTGTLVREIKSVGVGDNNVLVDEYVFDAALMRELRELERHAAQELGQWNPGGTDEAAAGAAAAAAAAASQGPVKVVFEWKKSSDTQSNTTPSSASNAHTTPKPSSKGSPVQ